MSSGGSGELSQNISGSISFGGFSHGASSSSTFGSAYTTNQQSSAASDEPSHHTRGDFIVFENEVIGEGGFGTVFKGLHTATGATVAAKILHGADPATSMAEMAKEVHMLSRLQHPNIVRIVGYDLSNFPPCLFMEWMSGGSVADLLARFGPGVGLPRNLVARYGRDMLSGLHYLHKHKVLSRDVKVQNTLLTAEGTAKLSDFGLARAFRSSSSSSSQQKSGNVAGTVTHLSPEAVGGKFSPASDIWAFAVSLLQMATNEHPWSHLEHCRGNQIALLFAIGSATPPNHHPRIPSEGVERSRYPALTAELVDVLERCFAFDRHARPSAKELLEHPYFDERQFASAASSPISVVSAAMTAEESGDVAPERTVSNAIASETSFTKVTDSNRTSSRHAGAGVARTKVTRTYTSGSAPINPSVLSGLESMPDATRASVSAVFNLAPAELIAHRIHLENAEKVSRTAISGEEAKAFAAVYGSERQSRFAHS